MRIKHFSHFKPETHFLSKMSKMSTFAHFCDSGAHKSWNIIGSIDKRVRRCVSRSRRNISWKYFYNNVFVKIFSRKYFQREELFILNFIKISVSSKHYKTNTILMILKPGITENQLFGHFRTFYQKMTFRQKVIFCQKSDFMP